MKILKTLVVALFVFFAGYAIVQSFLAEPDPFDINDYEYMTELKEKGDYEQFVKTMYYRDSFTVDSFLREHPDFWEKAQSEAKNIAYADSITNRLESIKKQFSYWDGAHTLLERSIKSSMADPKSYDHIETKWLDKDDHILVTTRFRERNSFGGMEIKTVEAKITIAGEIIEAKYI